MSILITFLGGCQVNSATDNSKNSENSDIEKGTQELKYKRIVITGNCPFGIALADDNIYKHVIGAGPWAFKNSNMKLLKDIKPDIERITTNFISTDYKVNLEALTELKPDAIYHYGKNQNDNLERTGLPIFDLHNPNIPMYAAEENQIYWENKFNETLGLKYSHKFKDIWSKEKKDLEPYAKKNKKNHLKALFVHTSNSKQIRISGKNSFGDSYLKMAGFENVAKDLEAPGDSGRYIDVSMEQINKWNPDIVFVAFGSAKNLLENKYPGQNWSGLSAAKSKKIFSCPVGTHNWGGLSDETALLPLYMINKAQPDIVKDEIVEEKAKDLYKKLFNYDIPKGLLDDVLSLK